MINLIEDLYFENFNQRARNAPSHDECLKYTEQAAKLRDKFIATLQEEQLQLYMEYDKVLNNVSDANNRETFVAGFRLGARLTLDAFYE